MIVYILRRKIFFFSKSLVIEAEQTLSSMLHAHDDKLKNSKDVISDISATSATLDVDDYFIEGQFPTCFSCHKAISELSQLTNIDCKPIHVCCKAIIEAQKRGKRSCCDGYISMLESCNYFD